jgi:hypothetical protein
MLFGVTIVSKQLSNLRRPKLCGSNLPAPASHLARPIPLWIANWTSRVGAFLQAGGEDLAPEAVLINMLSTMRRSRLHHALTICHLWAVYPGDQDTFSGDVARLNRCVTVFVVPVDML